MIDRRSHRAPGARRAQLQSVQVVIDLETDDEWNRVLGQHRCTTEDTVEYIDTDGGIRQAPADCVAVRTVIF